MMKNRFAAGSIIAGAITIAALAFNTLIFPSILTDAMRPKTQAASHIQIIASQALTSSFTSHMIPASDVPDSNYISEEKALSLVRAEVDKPYFSTAAMNYITIFKKSTGPAEGAVWQIVFTPTPEEITGVTSCNVLINAKNGIIIRPTINYEATTSMRSKLDKLTIPNGNYNTLSYSVIYFDRDEIMTDYKAGLSQEEVAW